MKFHTHMCVTCALLFTTCTATTAYDPEYRHRGDQQAHLQRRRVDRQATEALTSTLPEFTRRPLGDPDRAGFHLAKSIRVPNPGALVAAESHATSCSDDLVNLALEPTASSMEIPSTSSTWTSTAAHSPLVSSLSLPLIEACGGHISVTTVTTHHHHTVYLTQTTTVTLNPPTPTADLADVFAQSSEPQGDSGDGPGSWGIRQGFNYANHHMPRSSVVPSNTAVADPAAFSPVMDQPVDSHPNTGNGISLPNYLQQAQQSISITVAPSAPTSASTCTYTTDSCDNDGHWALNTFTTTNTVHSNSTAATSVTSVDPVIAIATSTSSTPAWTQTSNSISASATSSVLVSSSATMPPTTSTTMSFSTSSPSPSTFPKIFPFLSFQTSIRPVVHLHVTPTRSTASPSLTPSAIAFDPAIRPVLTGTRDASLQPPPVTPTSTVCGNHAPSGVPSRVNLHCGVHGRPVGDYFLGQFVENAPGLDVTLEGCWKFCFSVWGDTNGCQSYDFYLEPGLNVPRCDLYGSPVAYALARIDNHQPDSWFDLNCGDPTSSEWTLG